MPWLAILSGAFAQDCSIGTMTPAPWEPSVGADTTVEVTYAGNLDDSTVHPGVLSADSELTGRVYGTIGYYRARSVFDPSATFRAGERVTATFTRGVYCQDGSMLRPRVWQWDTAATAGSASFPSVASTPAGDLPTQPAVADFDGDGALDVLLPDAATAEVTVLFDRGGVLVVEDTYTVSTELYRSLAADPDGDGDMDVFLSGAPATLMLLRNDGGGGFTVEGVISALSGPVYAMAYGDVDGDADGDLVAAGEDGPLRVHFNNGAGSFDYSRELSAVNGPYRMILADVDRDDDLDIVGGSRTAETLTVWRNYSGGHFRMGWSRGVPDVTQIEAADLDGDGSVDLAVGMSGPGRLMTFSGRGDGSFVRDVVRSGDAADLCAGDLDADGDADLVLMDVARGRLVPLVNDGLGRFTAGAPSPTATVMDSMRCVDRDGDGAIDVVASAQPGALFEFYNPP